MKHFIALFVLTFSTMAYAGGPTCGPGYGHDNQGGCSPKLMLNEDGSPLQTIERVLLNRNGEEVECAVCCSWVSQKTGCIQTCLIEDDKMIPAAHLPPEDLPDAEFCKRFPGSNFCGGH